MKFTEFLKEIGSVVAYYPSITNCITDSSTATLFFCQLFYWSDKTNDPDGWIYKDSDELKAETGLTYYEQTTAREKLIKLELLEEEYKRLDHKIRFRLDLDKFSELWDKSHNRYVEPVATDTTKSKMVTNPREYLQSFLDRPLPPENPPESSDKKPPEKKGDLVDGILAFNQSPGMKKEKIKNDIKEMFERGWHINMDNRKWEKFIEFAYKRQITYNEKASQFMEWVNKNDLNNNYWTPERAMTFYPKAFVEEDKLSQQAIDSFVQEPVLKQEEYVPMPEELKRKKNLY